MHIGLCRLRPTFPDHDAISHGIMHIVWHGIIPTLLYDSLKRFVEILNCTECCKMCIEGHRHSCSILIGNGGMGFFQGGDKLYVCLLNAIFSVSRLEVNLCREK